MGYSREQVYYLQQMGIDVWLDRNAVVPPAFEPAVDAGVQLPRHDSLEALALEVSTCQRCPLAQSRTQTVFGTGNPLADWLFIGEAPGADEDRQGEPFVGKAGQLLTKMIKAVGYDREEVYIANILKCRPPNNRDPQPDEVAQCEEFLRQQIELIQPKIIVAVGRIAAQNLLKVSTPISKLRGKVHHYSENQIPVIATYHPAYLLRSPAEKRNAWEDLKLAMRTMKERHVS